MGNRKEVILLIKNDYLLQYLQINSRFGRPNLPVFFLPIFECDFSSDDPKVKLL